MVHILLKPGLENVKHYFTSVWDDCNCAVVWALKIPCPFLPSLHSHKKNYRICYTPICFICAYIIAPECICIEITLKCKELPFVSRWALTLKSGDARCLVSPSWVSTPETFPLPIIISHLYLSKRSNFSHSSSPPFHWWSCTLSSCERNPSVDILSSLQHKSTRAYVLLPFLPAEFWKFSDHMASQERILRTSLVV